MKSEGVVEIHWTCGSLEEARRIARQLVEMRLVASAQIIPWIESIFIWDNQLDTSQESKVIFKTCADQFEEVKKFILKHAQYEVPEILEVPVTRGNPEYLEWVIENTHQVKGVKAEKSG